MAIQKGPSGILGTSIEAGEITDGSITPAKLSTGGPNWDTSGNVGIGTSSPSEKLTVVASTGGTGGIRVETQYGQGYFGNYNNYPAMMYNSSGLKPVVVYDTNNHITSLHTDNTERLRIDADGLKFNGDTAAANALDDYEEGSWTPVLTPGSGSITSQSSYGYYTKIGNSVTVLFAVRIVTGGTASGVGYISGLPFTSQTVNPTLAGARAGTVSVREDGVTGNWYFGYVWSNDTQMTVTNSTNGGLNYANSCCYVSSFVYRSAT